MTVPTVQIISGVMENNVTNNKQDKTNVLFSWCKAHWRNFLSEFISTLMLILFGCMTAIPITGQESGVYTALGFGMIVMFNVQIFGHLSGAHMNPVVTLATVIWGTTSIPVAIVYAITQCLGSIAGYGILDALISADIVSNGICVTRPLAGQSSLQSLGIEVAITIALIFINCAIWDPVNKKKQDSASIKFGLTIVGLSLVGGQLTGASMNPARTLGPAIWTNIWTDHWIYWVGPVLGSVFATILYKFIFLEKQKDDWKSEHSL